MLKGDMAMRKLIIPIQFIMVMGCLALNGYAEQPKEKPANSLGMEFVLIKPGKFMMGSPEDEPGRYTGERLPGWVWNSVSTTIRPNSRAVNSSALQSHGDCACSPKSCFLTSPHRHWTRR